MVIIEKTAESDIYIFNSGTENEKRLEWTVEDDSLPRQNPPFMLENDILSYVKEIESILSITKGENLEIVEKRYRGLNNVLSRIMEENEGYIFDIEVRGSECGDWIGIVCVGILGEGGIDSSCKSLETVLPRIKKLVDSKHAFVKVKGDVLSVSDWWLKERDFGLFPGVVVLYELWMYLNIKVEETYHLFEKNRSQSRGSNPCLCNIQVNGKNEKLGDKNTIGIKPSDIYGHGYTVPHGQPIVR